MRTAFRTAPWLLLGCVAFARGGAAEPPANEALPPKPPALRTDGVDPDVLRKVRRLLKGTLEEDVSDRETAWRGLSNMGNLAVPALLVLAQQPDTTPAMTGSILIALGDSKDPRAGPALVELLAHPNRQVRLGAARALGDSKYKAGIPALQKHFADAAEDEEVRLFAAAAAAKLGAKEALAALRELACSTHPETRSRANFNLARYGGKDCLDAVAAAVDDPDEDVRTDALEALRQIGGEGLSGPLAKALLDRSYKVRNAARTIFQQQTDLLPGLVKCLKDADPVLREAAAAALGETHFKPALAALKERAADLAEDEPVRLAAAVAALRLGDKDAADTLRFLAKSRRAAMRVAALGALGRCGVNAVPEGLAALEDRDASVREQAVAVLRAAQDKAALPALLKALRDAEEGVRLAAYAALKDLSGEELANDPKVWQEWWDKEAKEEKTEAPK